LCQLSQSQALKTIILQENLLFPPNLSELELPNREPIDFTELKHNKKLQEIYIEKKK